MELNRQQQLHQPEEALEEEVSFNLKFIATQTFKTFRLDSEQSISESSFADNDESQASTCTADMSTLTDSSKEPEVLIADDDVNPTVVEVQTSEQIDETPSMEMEFSIEPKVEVTQVEVAVEQQLDEEKNVELEPSYADESLHNLEQQMNEVILDEPVEQKVTSAVSCDAEQISEDISMVEESVEESPASITVECVQQAAEEVSTVQAEVVVKKEEVNEISLELQNEFMDIEDIEDAPSVRRSRRLKIIHTEPFPFKTEEHPAPIIIESVQESSQSTANIVESDPSRIPTNDTLVKEEVVSKPAPEVQMKVEHTDIRLKRYETIRDNIYSKKSDKKVCKVNKTMKCDCTITEEEVRKGEVGCQYNCINRILYIECGQKCRCGEYCDNQQFRRYNYSSCSVFETTCKGFGIRADHDIPADTFIIEYVGEVLDNKQFEKRAKKYSENKNVHYYFMALKSNAIIDATKKGNISRFINHSCDPNAETQKWTVNGELRVGFFSRKDIKQGDEITFDYQYQRYGKEAQKCLCDATNCRGWIGENPLEEGDEEEVSENLEIDDPKSKKTKARKGRKPKAVLDKLEPEQEVKNESESDDEEERARIAQKKREAANKLAKKRKEFDDMEVEGEINDLVESGLKNRAHTIRLSRLIVRVMNVAARSRLLKILIKGELSCRRLFLDYNGLKLLHFWMIDTNVKTSIPDLDLCIEMMNVLDLMPITNKTGLRTSKVLDRVEKWKNLDLEKKTKEKTKEKMTKEERKQMKAEKKKNKVEDKKPETADEDAVKQEDPDQSGGEPLKDITDLLQSHDENAPDELTEAKLRVKQVASELLEKWEDLKEDFKIPKKQKQEIMIEHERQADDWDDDDVIVQRGDVLSNDRFKNRFGDDAQSAGGRTFATPYKKQFDPIVSKQQRRQMFERKVAQHDTEKCMMTMHENNCAIFGLNPNATNPLDVPVRVNRVSGEYNTIDGRSAPPPPNHYQFKYEPLTLSTNPDDYVLPFIDLPDHWRFALDVYGRIYYYHDKIRQSQWEAPIKILPLKVRAESEEDSPDSDESTTETEDSEEEELRELLEMLKRKALLPPVKQTSATNPLVLSSGDGEEDELEKQIMNNMLKNPLDQPMKLSQLPQKRVKSKKRHGLTSIQFIRPRTEADKIYGRTESKRYKEVKEKLRQKKRRVLKGESGPADGSSNDEDDDIEIDESIESRKFVDELDILEKSELDGARSKAKKEAEKKGKKAKPIVDQAEIRRQFRDEMKREIGKFLQPYREESCENGKITNDADFGSLVNKVTVTNLHVHELEIINNFFVSRFS